jgi:hypothetical protein
MTVTDLYQYWDRRKYQPSGYDSNTDPPDINIVK